jgi:AraC-like DNA-binding protein
LQQVSTEEFLANPVGHYCVGRRYCVFASAPTLFGFASWGRPDVDDVTELLHACGVGLTPGMVPYRWLVDVRGLELIEPGTFGLFLEYTRKNREVLGKNIVRQAQLRPDGMVGAIISGFSHLASLSYPDRVFGDVAEALTWLDVEAQQGSDLVAEIEAIRDESRESYAIVGRLREELNAAGAFAVETAARTLGLSTRSLQRALRQAGTTYRMELKSFRIRRAQELLRDGERNLSAIALEVGFSSAQHFATAYRRAIGVTPSAWRARNRESA